MVNLYQMKKLKGFIFQIIVLIKKFRYLFFHPKQDQVLFKEIPYHSQFASKEDVQLYISGKKNVLDDPKWKTSGAKKREEYAIWAWNGCGMVCLQMILEYRLHKNIPFVELGKRCLAYGGYRINKRAQKENDYNNYYDGLFYQPFIKFIKNEFHLTAYTNGQMIYQEIINELDRNKLVIASVSPNIRNPKSSPHARGGHLVLMVGYDMPKQCFYLHNPSEIYKASQEFTEISFTDFNTFFAHRGIVIHN